MRDPSIAAFWLFSFPEIMGGFNYDGDVKQKIWWQYKVPSPFCFLSHLLVDVVFYFISSIYYGILFLEKFVLLWLSFCNFNPCSGKKCLHAYATYIECFIIHLKSLSLYDMNSGTLAHAKYRIDDMDTIYSLNNTCHLLNKEVTDVHPYMQSLS